MTVFMKAHGGSFMYKGLNVKKKLQSLGSNCSIDMDGTLNGSSTYAI